MKIRGILCPMDFSELSRRALTLFVGSTAHRVVGDAPGAVRAVRRR